MSRACVLFVMLFAAGSVLRCDKDTRSTMEIELQGPDPTPWQGLSVVIRSGDSARQLDIGDFIDEEEPHRLRTTVEVPEAGELVLEISLVEEGESVAAGTADIGAREDFSWVVDLLRIAEEPGCIGCLGSVEIGILQEQQRFPGETLWVTWGGHRRGEHPPPF